MKTNITSLMTLIAEEERNFNSKSYTLITYAMNTTVEELDGRKNIIEDNKESFDVDLSEIEKSSKEITKLKSILYNKNNELKLTDGRSIQEAIVDNTNLRKLKSTYEALLTLKNSKKRITEVNNSYFECKTINFDSKKIKEEIEKMDIQIQKTDFEISKLNSIEFEI